MRGPLRCTRHVALLVLLAVLAAEHGCARQEPADLVVLNGKVVTVDDAFTVASAVAVRDGRIVAVPTSEAEARAFVGPDTRVIDAGGRTVIPGLIDTHVHALGVAATEATAPFQNLTSVAQIQEWVRREASATPAGTWLWTPRLFPTRLSEKRFPTREELDAAAPDHPVVVDGAYALMINTAALRAAAITSRSPNPPGGAIVKDEAGQPTGLLRNVGALLARFRSSTDTGVPLDALEQVHRAYNRVGITSVIERGASPDGYRRYAALAAAQRLHVRATITLQLPRPEDEASLTRAFDDLPLRPGEGDDRLKVGPLKILVDGGILAGTAYMREPYGPPAAALYGVNDQDYRGFLTVPPALVQRFFAIGHARGWQMSAHVTGDAGVDTVLDAIEAAQQQPDVPATNRRHTLIHAYFANADTAERAARLGVLVDTQPAWYYKDADALADALGRQRLAHFIGLRTWRDAGVHTAINTDHMFGVDGNTAMNPFNPFLTMYVAVSRRTEGGQVIGPDEAVSREEALRMMTREAAFFSFDEANRGSLEVGKLADLVVISEDLLTCPVEQLRTIEADITVVGGTVVHDRGRR